jgi:hypothetical protein
MLAGIVTILGFRLASGGRGFVAFITLVRGRRCGRFAGATAGCGWSFLGFILIIRNIQAGRLGSALLISRAGFGIS